MNRSLSSEPAFDPSVFINHRSMMAPKKSRKQVENDAKALSNRLSLLQKEESKIWKNLELAKTKAYELYLIKKRDAERNKDKQMKNEESFMGSQGRQLNSMLIRKQREETIFNLKEALQRQKHKEMLIVKRQSEMMRVRKQDFEERFLVENRNKMLTVKKQELLSNFKKKAFFEDKLIRVKQDQQKRLDEEEDFKVMKELEVLNMEKAEMEMVQRIHKAKDLQKQVYKNLESMLTFNENGDVVDNREYKPTQLSAKESEPVLGSIRMRSLNGSVLGEEQDSTQRLQVVEKVRSRSVRRLSFR